jgi:hypothetical protein
MAKTYPDQLGLWVKLRKSTRRDKNLVAFLAVRDDVKAALDTGYSVKTVWTNMYECQRIEFSYDTFLNQVNRLIRRPQASKAAMLATPTATIDDSNPTSKAAAKKPAAQTMKPEAATGFTFNSAPKKEDLI